MLLLQQMIVLLIYMMIGYVACKRGKLDEIASDRFSWLVVHVANPMLVISSAVNSEGEIQGKELLLTMGIAVGMYAVFLVLAEILPGILQVEKQDVPLYKLMTVFNNMGFMGFPVISAVYGGSALLYASVFMLPFNLLFYTYGMQVADKENHEKLAWKKIFNVGVLTCILASALYLSKIPVPDFIKSVSKGLGNLNGPLSMMVIGISMTKMKFQELFSDQKLFLFTFIKLMLIPVTAGILLRQFIGNEILCGVVTIIMSTPVSSMTVMLAQEKCEHCEAIVKGISLTTLLSVITIPLVSAVVSFW